MWERDRRVVVEDGGLDPFDGQVGQVAGVALAAEAEEVEVDRSGLAAAGRDREPALAAVTPDGALQVVMMVALAGAGHTVRPEYMLHPVEEFRVDQRFVPSGVLMAPVGDV